MKADARAPTRDVAAHRYAWERLHGPIPPGLFACHKCDNTGCVNPSHVFLGTHKNNMADRNAKMRMSHGVKHFRAKLTPEAVREIRALRAAGAFASTLAARFGVTKGTIEDMLNGRTWRHVT